MATLLCFPELSAAPSTKSLEASSGVSQSTPGRYEQWKALSSYCASDSSESRLHFSHLSQATQLSRDTNGEASALSPFLLTRHEVVSLVSPVVAPAPCIAPAPLASASST
jgi:hypothetical protein